MSTSSPSSPVTSIQAIPEKVQRFNHSLNNMVFNACRFCDQAVYVNDGVFIHSAQWHKGCFKCGALAEVGCQRVLSHPSSPPYFHYFGCPFCTGCANKYFHQGRPKVYIVNPDITNTYHDMDGDNGGGNNAMKGSLMLPNDSNNNNNQPPSQQQQQHLHHQQQHQQQHHPMTVSGERARRAFRARVLEAQAAVLMREDDVLHIPQVDRDHTPPFSSSPVIISGSSYPFLPPRTLPSRPFPPPQPLVP